MRSWWLTAALAGIALSVQTYGLYRVSGPPAPPWFPQIDKVEHALGFALPVFLVLVTLVLRQRALGGPEPRRATVAAVLAVFGLHAVLSEIIQDRFYRSRSGDPLDVVADGTGIALGWLGHRLVVRRLGRAPVPK